MQKEIYEGHCYLYILPLNFTFSVTMTGYNFLKLSKLSQIQYLKNLALLRLKDQICLEYTICVDI